MKKKILFIVSNMESGGVSKSMSSLLNVVDTQKYEVDCFITNPTGIFIDTIPPEIQIISDSRTALLFSAFPRNILQLLKKGYLYDALIRTIVAFLMKVDRGWAGWLLSRRIYKIKKSYDLAVDYNGQHQLYYLIDSIKAKKKITFFHSDYERWPYYFSVDKNYLPKADAVFTISAQCHSSLENYFPDIRDKITVFENITSPVLIEALASQIVADPIAGERISLITVGHVSESKGSLLALKAAKILKDYGWDFKWYFLGNLQDIAFYSNFVRKLSLENQIVFMGLRKNPYPYLRQATLVVHPSQFEGKSIALDEAKILGKPIVVTNFSTVYDQFTDRVNASICEMTPENLAADIMELLQNEELQKQYASYLTRNQVDNSGEIEKLYKFLKDT